jgi:hypothetical protein
MLAQPIDRRIAELLNDPLTSLVIQADGVDRARLAAQLRRLAEAIVGPDTRRSSSLFGDCAP